MNVQAEQTTLSFLSKKGGGHRTAPPGHPQRGRPGGGLCLFCQNFLSKKGGGLYPGGRLFPQSGCQKKAADVQTDGHPGIRFTMRKVFGERGIRTLGTNRARTTD